MTRCGWVGREPIYQAYHDQEWGVPVWDDRALFEKLVLDGFQAGLSWLTILKKRENFLAAFDGFEPSVIANYGPEKVESLMGDSGIVRNRAKIEATIRNARGWLQIMELTGSFADYLWAFVGGRPLINHWRALSDVPVETDQSKAMSKDLRAKGFGFVGPTICYAFMQAVGMVNDHTTDCFRHREIANLPEGP